MFTPKRKMNTKKVVLSYGALAKKVQCLETMVKKLKTKNVLMAQESAITDQVIKQVIKLVSTGPKANFCDRLHPSCKILHSRYSYTKPNPVIGQEKIEVIKPTPSKEELNKPGELFKEVSDNGFTNDVVTNQLADKLVKNVARKIDDLSQLKYGIPPAYSHPETTELIHFEFQVIWQNISYFHRNYQCKILEPNLFNSHEQGSPMLPNKSGNKHLGRRNDGPRVICVHPKPIKFSAQVRHNKPSSTIKSTTVLGNAKYEGAEDSIDANAIAVELGYGVDSDDTAAIAAEHGYFDDESLDADAIAAEFGYENDSDDTAAIAAEHGYFEDTNASAENVGYDEDNSTNGSEAIAAAVEHGYGMDKSFEDLATDHDNPSADVSIATDDLAAEFGYGDFSQDNTEVSADEGDCGHISDLTDPSQDQDQETYSQDDLTDDDSGSEYGYSS